MAWGARDVRGRLEQVYGEREFMSESKQLTVTASCNYRLKPIVPIVLHQCGCTPNELYACGDDTTN